MKLSFNSNGHVKSKRPHRAYRSSRRHYRGRVRAAVKRAFTAAGFYRKGEFKTLAEAAMGCGSNVAYIRAALILIETNNTALIRRVEVGDVPLMKAAQAAHDVAGLVKAYRTANAEDHVAFAKIVGPATIFDNMIVPAI